jgi:riboflavin kinase/FMN adenylyltransferase
MQIITWEEFLQKPLDAPCAATIGVFDGVHRGHQALIDRIKKQNLASVVVTFKQNPRRALCPGRETQDIVSLDEKIGLLAGRGIDLLILIDFSSNFARIDGADFIKVLAENARLGYLAIGKDFKCGRGGQFDARLREAFCAENGIACEILEPVLDSGEPVSSSRIRKALLAGENKTAERLLGHPLKKIKPAGV